MLPLPYSHSFKGNKEIARGKCMEEENCVVHYSCNALFLSSHVLQQTAVMVRVLIMEHPLYDSLAQDVGIHTTSHVISPTN